MKRVPQRNYNLRSARLLVAALTFVFAGWVLSSWHDGAARADDDATAEEAEYGEDYGLRQVRFINQQIRQGWTDWGFQPSPAATDSEWCRRIYLDVIGRVPSVQELSAFVDSRSKSKRPDLVETLLNDEVYIEEYARNWTTIWTNLLIGRNGGSEDNTLTSREGMQKYVRDSFARNKPYDQFVFELITATGTNTPGSPGFNGAVNFLTMKLDEDGAQATAQTAKLFLGMQVQCTQCHNHPFNDWKQQKFWEMNAFFRQTVALRRFVPGTRNIRIVELANQDFGGEGSTPEEAELYYELRNGVVQAAYPVFIDGAAISPSGYLSEVNRRDEFGRLVTQSPYMGEAMANRMWGYFLGHGFTKPVDDIGPHNPPSHPELMVYLGEQFKENSYDLKELIRWIVLSEAYSLSSRRTRANAGDDPLMGETPKYTHFYLRQMRAEQLYESLLVVTQAHKTRGSYEEQEAAKAMWLKQFIIAFGTDEGDESTTFNGTITQSLMMFNGDLIEKAISAEAGGYLHTIATSNLSSRAKIEYLYQAALSRDPTGREVQIANQLLAAREGNTTAALQDVFWALLNSNEFIINH